MAKAVSAMVIGGLLPIGLAAGSGNSVPMDRDRDTKVIASYIQAQAHREHGEEDQDARQILAGAADGDGTTELVALYTIEGQHGSNNYVQYLAVFTHKAGSLIAVARTKVGGKSGRSVDLQSVDQQTINLETLTYAPADPACCPSVKGVTGYTLVGTKLVERVARAHPASQ